jgi:hypothetical protein
MLNKTKFFLLFDSEIYIVYHIRISTYTKDVVLRMNMSKVVWRVPFGE